MEDKITQTLRGSLLFCLWFLLFCGCATTPTFHVDIDSISSPNADSKKKYILLPGIKDVKNTDLQFIEYTKYIDKALLSKGFIKADTFEDANVALFLVYGIGNPQKSTYSYALPIWGHTSLSSSAHYGNLHPFGNTSTHSGSITYTPRYGITDFVPVSGSYVTYSKFFILDAVDLDEYKQSQQMHQLWQTTVTSTGSSGDLRLVFPILVAASKEYLGLNTGKKIHIKLTENDQRVVEIKTSLDKL